ncbi:hypothetical protein OG592_03750 [Streptomyces avidinii]|uniref:hypothetical protein n=1 Tax=Streptomyces avidinii TaxID=1895 RepID=UPI00386CCD39|nr:hypothetical protein OG592_03750 [Streptomyces avidinii]
MAAEPGKTTLLEALAGRCAGDVMGFVPQQPLGLGPDHQLLDQLVIHSLHPLRLGHLDGFQFRHVVTGHRHIFHDQE